MAKTILGGVFTTDTDGGLTSSAQVSTENVCGLVIDTAIVGGMDTALGEGVAKTVFGKGNVVELNSKKDVAEAGLDDTVMSGLPAYHLNTFFTLAGDNQRIFLTFMDSTSDKEFEAVQRLQLAADGIIYNVGVWTGKPIANKGDGSDDYTVIDGGVIGKLQAQAESLGGKIGVVNYEGHAPISVFLTAPVVLDKECDYKRLPDISNSKCCKVTMLLGQAASDEVHNIMIKLGGIAPVGCVGAALAVTAVAPVDLSIANVSQFNLAAAINNAELGFGNLLTNEENNAFDPNAAFTNIKTILYNKRAQYLHNKGYVFIGNVDGIEGGVFFSSDQTLDAESDYRSIMRCRIMHKARRVVRQSLLKYVNETWKVQSNGTLSAAAVSTIKSTITKAIDGNMVRPGTRVAQISGRTANVDASKSLLENDSINVSFGILPPGCSAAIFCTEGFIVGA